MASQTCCTPSCPGRVMPFCNNMRQGPCGWQGPCLADHELKTCRNRQRSAALGDVGMDKHTRRSERGPVDRIIACLRVHGLPSLAASSGSTVRMEPVLKPRCSRRTECLQTRSKAALSIVLPGCSGCTPACTGTTPSAFQILRCPVHRIQRAAPVPDIFHHLPCLLLVLLDIGAFGSAMTAKV